MRETEQQAEDRAAQATEELENSQVPEIEDEVSESPYTSEDDSDAFMDLPTPRRGGRSLTQREVEEHNKLPDRVRNELIISDTSDEEGSATSRRKGAKGRQNSPDPSNQQREIATQTLLPPPPLLNPLLQPLSAFLQRKAPINPNAHFIYRGRLGEGYNTVPGASYGNAGQGKPESHGDRGQQNERPRDQGQGKKGRKVPRKPTGETQKESSQEKMGSSLETQELGNSN